MNWKKNLVGIRLKKAHVSCESNLRYLRHPADETTPPEWSLWGTVGTPDRSTRYDQVDPKRDVQKAAAAGVMACFTLGSVHRGPRPRWSAMDSMYAAYALKLRVIFWGETGILMRRILINHWIWGYPMLKWTLFRIKPSILGGQWFCSASFPCANCSYESGAYTLFPDATTSCGGICKMRCPMHVEFIANDEFSQFDWRRLELHSSASIVQDSKKTVSVCQRKRSHFPIAWHGCWNYFQAPLDCFDSRFALPNIVSVLYLSPRPIVGSIHSKLWSKLWGRRGWVQQLDTWLLPPFQIG